MQYKFLPKQTYNFGQNTFIAEIVTLDTSAG